MHWGIGFWPLFPILWIGIIVFLCVSARRWFGGRERQRSFPLYGEGPHGAFHTPFEAPVEPDALEILRRRYARSEIDGTTFDQMHERLERSIQHHT